MVLEVILGVLFCWFFSSILHELSHIVVGYFLYGLKPIGIYPFWHWSSKNLDVRYWRPWELWKRPEGYDHFYFASYKAEGFFPTGKHELLHSIPVLVDLVFILVSLSYFILNGGVLPVIVAFAFGIDAFVWVLGYFSNDSNTDGYRYRYGLRQ